MICVHLKNKMCEEKLNLMMKNEKETKNGRRILLQKKLRKKKNENSEVRKERKFGER